MNHEPTLPNGVAPTTPEATRTSAATPTNKTDELRSVSRRELLLAAGGVLSAGVTLFSSAYYMSRMNREQQKSVLLSRLSELKGTLEQTRTYNAAAKLYADDVRREVEAGRGVLGALAADVENLNDDHVHAMYAELQETLRSLESEIRH